MNKIFSIFFIATLFFLSTYAVTAETYYLSNSGNDAGSGLLPAPSAQGSDGPWRTIGKVNATAFSPGDSILFKRGETWNEQLIVSSSGSEEAPIVFGAYGECENNPLIDGTGLSFNWAGLIYLHDQSCITIQDLTIKNSPKFGIAAITWDEQSVKIHHLKINNCSITDCISAGIYCANEAEVDPAGFPSIIDLTIDGNNITRTNTNPAGWDLEAISLRDVQTFVIRNNEISDTVKEGITTSDCSHGKIYKNEIHDLKGGPGIYIVAWDGYQHDIEVYRNKIYDSECGIAIATEMGGSCENINIYNNLIYHTTSGFFICDYAFQASGPHLKKNIKLINNTFHANSNCIQIVGKSENFFTKQLVNLFIRNNIFSGPDFSMVNITKDIEGEPLYHPDLLLETSIFLDHNLIQGYSDYFGEKAVADEDPEFTNAPEFTDFLTGPAPSGSREISVRDATGYEPGDIIEIDLGILRSVSWASQTKVGFEEPLKLDHPLPAETIIGVWPPGTTDFAKDFRLQSVSPAIDRGIHDQAPFNDYDGCLRLPSEGCDIGAFEYEGVLKIDPGDYTGDGKTDIAIFRPQTGLWSVRGNTRIYYGTNRDLPVAGDYDGEGNIDVAIYRPETALWSIRGVSRVYYGREKDVPVPGDYDKDGISDIAVFRPATGLWAIEGVTRVYFGKAGDIPLPRDYNRDGITDIAVFRPETGLWLIRGVTRVYYGVPGDIPVPGDYDGDGKMNIAIFRPEAALWSIRGVTRTYYGAPTDIPVPGGYAGDRETNIAIFRPETALWSIKDLFCVYHGKDGDIPVSGP